MKHPHGGAILGLLMKNSLITDPDTITPLQCYTANIKKGQEEMVFFMTTNSVSIIIFIKDWYIT